MGRRVRFRSARLSLYMFWRRRLQVVIPDSLEGVVAVEIVAADVVGRIWGADPAKRHRAQLSLRWKEKSRHWIYFEVAESSKHYSKILKKCISTYREFDNLFTVRVRRVLQQKKKKQNKNMQGQIYPAVLKNSEDFWAEWHKIRLSAC